MTVGNTIRLLRLREWLSFDSVVIASLLRSALALAGLLLYGLGSRKLSVPSPVGGPPRPGSPALVCRLVQCVVACALRMMQASRQQASMVIFASTSQHRPKGCRPNWPTIPSGCSKTWPSSWPRPNPVPAVA